jgi:hypothetical protein
MNDCLNFFKIILWYMVPAYLCCCRILVMNSGWSREAYRKEISCGTQLSYSALQVLILVWISCGFLHMRKRFLFLNKLYSYDLCLDVFSCIRSWK